MADPDARQQLPRAEEQKSVENPYPAVHQFGYPPGRRICAVSQGDQLAMYVIESING
jgi:hypothetical protein